MNGHLMVFTLLLRVVGTRRRRPLSLSARVVVEVSTHPKPWKPMVMVLDIANQPVIYNLFKGVVVPQFIRIRRPLRASSV